MQCPQSVDITTCSQGQAHRINMSCMDKDKTNKDGMKNLRDKRKRDETISL